MSHALAAVREGDTIRSQLAPIGDRESVGALLARNVARFGTHAVYSERRDGAFRARSWEAFAGDVASFAAFLSGAGVRRGARVAVVSPNRGEMLVAEFATMSLGATYVPIFAGYPAQQVKGLASAGGSHRRDRRRARPARGCRVRARGACAGHVRSGRRGPGRAVAARQGRSAMPASATRSRGSPPPGPRMADFLRRRRPGSIPASPACSTSLRAPAEC